MPGHSVDLLDERSGGGEEAMNDTTGGGSGGKTGSGDNRKETSETQCYIFIGVPPLLGSPVPRITSCNVVFAFSSLDARGQPVIDDSVHALCHSH